MRYEGVLRRRAFGETARRDAWWAAEAMANVDDRDGWKVHFADTMRGGQYLNHPRMAEIHAKEAPDRSRSPP